MTHDNQRLWARRGFLHGLGGMVLTLPWLESFPLAADEVRADGKKDAPAAGQHPVRFACLFFSNGVEPEHWWARGNGKAMEIGPGLAPMQPLREELIFVRGLFNEQAVRHKSAHLGRSPNMLSG